LKSFQKNKKSFCKFLRFLVKYIPCLNQPKPRTTAYRVFSYASVNTHRVWETSIERGETSIECGKRPSSVGKHTSSVGKHPSSVGNTHRAWGNVGVHRGVAEGGPRRCRRLSGGGWVGFKFPILGKIADEVLLNCLDLRNIFI
jgi:hypothetical protein